MATKNDNTGDPKRAANAAAPPGRGSNAVGEDDDVAFAVMAGIAVLAAVILLLTGVLNTSAGTASSNSAAAGPIAQVEAAVNIEATHDTITLSGVVPDQATADRLRESALATYGADHVVDHLVIIDGAHPLTVNITGEVADDHALAELTQSFAGLTIGDSLTNHLSAAAPQVDEPTTEVEEIEEEPAAVAANATITASDDGIVLDGIVPSEAIATQLRDVAAANYGPDQIADNLEVLDGAEPFTLMTTGSLSSAATLDSLSASLQAVEVDGKLVNGLELSEEGEIVAALNDLVLLEPILFETSSAVIVAESQATIDEAAAILKEFPGAAIEIGGHTDSRGGAEANKALSDARAQSVLAALIERGVSSNLTAVGYGEEQLKEDPDDTVEQQRLNRRIEFRVL